MTTDVRTLASMEARIRRLELKFERLSTRRERPTVGEILRTTIEDDGPSHKSELVTRVVELRPQTARSTVYRQMQWMLKDGRLIEDPKHVIHDARIYKAALKTEGKNGLLRQETAGVVP